jgi:hypothetical protein
MNRIPVSSSNILSIGYASEEKVLEIEFRNGSIFQYLNVPNNIYSGLMNARSCGRYFDAYVKKGNFEYKQIKSGGKST